MVYIIIFTICGFTLGYQDNWVAMSGIALLTYIACIAYCGSKAYEKLTEDYKILADGWEKEAKINSELSEKWHGLAKQWQETSNGYRKLLEEAFGDFEIKETNNSEEIRQDRKRNDESK